MSKKDKPPIKIVILGGRDLDDRPFVWQTLNAIHAENRIAKVMILSVSPTCAVARQWANANKVPVEVVVADRLTYGKSADGVRADQMSWQSDMFVVFGELDADTRKIINTARDWNSEIREFEPEPEPEIEQAGKIRRRFKTA
jgi:hypothetical protein